MHPPLYFINLDRTPARAIHMAATLDAMGLHATRIPAVDGRNLDETTCRNLNPINPKNDLQSAGEIGCWLSHRKIWEMIVSADHAYGVVFEDDIVFSKDAVQFLQDFSWIPADVDFVKIDSCHLRTELAPPRNLPGTDRTLRIARSAMISTAGYILSKQCARQLLERTVEIRSFTDLQLFDPKFCTFDPMKVWQLYPAICSQKGPADGHINLPDEVAKSDLLPVRQERKNAQVKLKFGPAKIRRELVRPFINQRLRPRDLVNRIWWRTTIQPIPYRE